jgi:predicted CXXCH cytochrome family protein
MFVRVAVVTFMVGLFGLAGPGGAATQGCLSGACHQGLTKSKYLHGPVAAELAGAKACVMCHLPAGPACTAIAKGSFKLKGKEICQACHTKGNGTQHSQAEVESKCLKCHAPHGSETSRQFLRGDKGALLKKK